MTGRSTSWTSIPFSVWSSDDGAERLPLPAVQHRRLRRVGARPLRGACPAVGVAHQLGKVGQGRAHGIRHLHPAADGLAHDQPEAVDEPAQRRGDVGVGRGDGRVLRSSGSSPSNAV